MAEPELRLAVIKSHKYQSETAEELAEVAVWVDMHAAPTFVELVTRTEVRKRLDDREGLKWTDDVLQFDGG